MTIASSLEASPTVAGGMGPILNPIWKNGQGNRESCRMGPGPLPTETPDHVSLPIATADRIPQHPLLESAPPIAPVAQLDRAAASGAAGHRFESCRAYQSTRSSCHLLALLGSSWCEGAQKHATCRGRPHPRGLPGDASSYQERPVASASGSANGGARGSTLARGRTRFGAGAHARLGEGIGAREQEAGSSRIGVRSERAAWPVGPAARPWLSEHRDSAPPLRPSWRRRGGGARRRCIERRPDARQGAQTARSADEELNVLPGGSGQKVAEESR
jgi:hypothetical protein